MYVYMINVGGCRFMVISGATGSNTNDCKGALSVYSFWKLRGWIMLQRTGTDQDDEVISSVEASTVC